MSSRRFPSAFSSSRHIPAAALVKISISVTFTLENRPMAVRILDMNWVNDCAFIPLGAANYPPYWTVLATPVAEAQGRRLTSTMSASLLVKGQRGPLVEVAGHPTLPLDHFAASRLRSIPGQTARRIADARDWTFSTSFLRLLTAARSRLRIASALPASSQFRPLTCRRRDPAKRPFAGKDQGGACNFGDFSMTARRTITSSLSAPPRTRNSALSRRASAFFRSAPSCADSLVEQPESHVVQVQHRWRGSSRSTAHQSRRERRRRPHRSAGSFTGSSWRTEGALAFCHYLLVDLLILASAVRSVAAGKLKIHNAHPGCSTACAILTTTPRCR